ncbi:nose resistant to fluoxetine protein 6-like [Neocloeon triangulifer]|uniref:nose resistant to fluoxetine protein 6-like n=1 Tax=Neocloeon triangulifer TaxID=2078957 RepID=UPI00286F6526|nr:nose resistant to fluoxetine protein 6-like [Neocloeon triangulifer]
MGGPIIFSIFATLIFGLGIVRADPSFQCSLDIIAYQAGISPLNPQLWALKMLDSSTKLPPDGILQGAARFQLGNYDECLAVRGPLSNDGVPRFKGKFCRAQLGFKQASNKTIDPKGQLILNQMQLAQERISKNINLRTGVNYVETNQLQNFSDNFLAQWAVCAPSTCNADGVKRVADFNLGQFFSQFNLDVDMTVIESSCYYEDDGSKDLDTGAWLFLITFMIFNIVLIFATICDYAWPKDKDMHVVVRAFSLRTNFRELFKLPAKSVPPGQLPCLHGLRVLSTFWVILLHVYPVDFFNPHMNLNLAINKYIHMWTMAPVLHGSLSVDTFFVLSGLLTVYVPLVDQKKGRKFNVFKYMIYRFIRITVPLAMVIFCLTTVLKRLSHGPLWDLAIELETKRCEGYWWATLVYIQNFYKPGASMCLGQGWYLQVDMQLALVMSPFVIIAMLKRPKIGLTLLGLLSFFSVALAFYYTFAFNLHMTNALTPNPLTTGNFGTLIYTNPAVRAAPYLAGMILAYLLANNVTIKMNKIWVVVEWLLNTALCLAIVYMIVIPYNVDYEYEHVGAAFFAGLHRFAWGVGISFIIWACTNGYGGIVNSILSWKHFLPLSKLSFCAYLVHIDMIVFHIGQNRANTYFSTFEVVFEYLGTLVMIIPLTLWLYVAVDAPCQTIIRTAFGKPAKFAQEHNKKHDKEEVAAPVEKEQEISSSGLQEKENQEDIVEVKSD